MVHLQAGSEGHRVAAEIQRIQTALHQVGFRTRKQPKQPIWTITAPDTLSYRLSFQPAPIRGWVLHPVDVSPGRQQITEIVQSVLAPERVSWQQSWNAHPEFRSDSRPWAIVMIQDAVQRSVITRFRNRQDADDHLRAIRRHMPQGVFEVVFDPTEQPMRASTPVLLDGSSLREHLAVQRRVLLARGRDNQRVETLLVDLAQKHLDDFEANWLPWLEQVGAEDKFWDWVVKKRISLSSDNFESYAIEYQGMTHGLMAIETQWHRSQIDRQNRLVYVQAIASAPWNRKAIQQPPTLRGVGTALLLFARQRSMELGYGGRVGLHALPGAESFYDDQNMADYGPDPDKENLTYFEYGRFQR